jgi:hypothetical protein
MGLVGSDLEPRPEHEFDVELSTADWLSQLGVKFNFAYRYRRQRRAGQFLTATAEYAETDEESLKERAVDDDALGDALVLAGERAVTTHDPELRDLLAHLVARAFQDDTRIEAISFLLRLAEQLEPIHLRVLKAVSVIPQDDPERPPFTTRVEAQVNADPGLTAAALLWLRSLGLVASIESLSTGPPGAGVKVGTPEWNLTDLGRELMRLSGLLDTG